MCVSTSFKKDFSAKSAECCKTVQGSRFGWWWFLPIFSPLLLLFWMSPWFQPQAPGLFLDTQSLNSLTWPHRFHMGKGWGNQITLCSRPLFLTVSLNISRWRPADEKTKLKYHLCWDTAPLFPVSGHVRSTCSPGRRNCWFKGEEDGSCPQAETRLTHLGRKPNNQGR